jgi:NitT/TauT family transport system permease protein
VWRPALAWAQKFKVEETAAAEAPRSLVLDLLRRSRIPGWLARQTGRLFGMIARQPALPRTADAGDMRRRLVRLGGWTVAGGALLFAVWGRRISCAS